MQQKPQQHRGQEEEQEQQYEMKQQQQLLNRSKEIRIRNGDVVQLSQLLLAHEPPTTVLNQQWINRTSGRVDNE